MTQSYFDAFYTDLFDKHNIIDSRFQVFLRNLIASLTHLGQVCSTIGNSSRTPVLFVAVTTVILKMG